jgi:hypothetical protein
MLFLTGMSTNNFLACTFSQDAVSDFIPKKRGCGGGVLEGTPSNRGKPCFFAIELFKGAFGSGLWPSCVLCGQFWSRLQVAL